jgi:hypothetical protein
MPDSLDTPIVELALARLGAVLEYHTEIDILLVGGAAGMLTGVLARGRTTTDCDVMVALPPEAMAAIERAAERVAAELGLAPRWLNSDVQIRRDVLPSGWATRKQLISQHGRLRVFAASRPDLIAMKVLAGRAQDIQDLNAMRMRADDKAFVLTYLDELTVGGSNAQEIADARELLEALEIHDAN